MRNLRNLLVVFAVLAGGSALLLAQTPLTANAGPDQTDAIVGQVVNLDGTQSTGATTYSWTFSAKPSGSAVVLTNPATSTPTFIPDRGGTYIIKLTVSNGITSKSDSVSITTINHPPTANAGPDLAAAVGKSVVFNGTLSSDPDNDRLLYSWHVVSAPPTSARVFTGATAAKPRLILDRPGEYVVEMMVYDGHVWSGTDQAMVTTTNTLPVANAGRDRFVTIGVPVQLDGTASSDIDEQLLSYSWVLTRPAASAAALSNATSPRPTFVPDVAGNYTATLTVDDGFVTRSDGVVFRTVTNVGPLARAGRDHPAMVAGQTIVLDGSDSTDDNGNALSYTWSITGRPLGSVATLDSPSSVRTAFTADLPGNYVFKLVVGDGLTTSSAVVRYSKARPLADAGVDRAVTVGSAVTLDGSASSHLTGTLAYGWALITRPAGSVATIADPADPQPQFVPDVVGTYVAQLIVFDGALLSPADTVVITAGDNAAPRVDLGPDQVVTMPSTVTLDSSAAVDPDGDPLSFKWALLARPAGSTSSLTSATGATTQLNPNVAGVYVVQLMATDADGLAAIDTVVITADAGRPIVTTGADKSAAPGSPVALAATVTDPDGGGVGYAWSFLRRPPGSAAAFSNPAAANPTFTPDVEGVYVAQVWVVDSDGLDAIDALVIRASSAGPPPPIVTIAASDPNAAELGLDTGTFTFTRTGNTSLALNGVAYTRTGSATAGADFTPNLPASGTVNFAAGQATTTITITPVADGLIEGSETVTLTLVDGAAYDLGVPSTQEATVTIADADGSQPGTNGALHTGAISFAGDVDTWTFAATAGDRIAVHVGEITDNNDFRPWIRLIAPDGTLLASTAGVAADVIDDIIAPATGTYSVLVASYDTGFDGTGTYRLTMVHTPGPITVSGGDQGGPLASGATHTGEILTGDVDVWTFNATAGQRLSVHVGQITDTNDFRPWLRVWAPNGASLGDSAGVNADVIDDVIAPVTGTYLVLVASFDSGFDGFGTYRLTLAATGSPVTVSTGDQGGPLTNGATHTGEILLGEVDVWTFNATVGQRIAVHVGQMTETDDFRPWIRVWAPNGASLGDTAGVNADVIDDIVAPVNGLYVVQVASFDSGFDGIGTYRLTLDATGAPITVSPGDQGGPMTNGATHTGDIQLGEVDAWTFDAVAGQRMSVHVGQTGETDDFRPWIRLWSPTGASLGDVAGVNATVIDDVIAPATGTYLVQVASFDAGFDGIGTYRVTLTATGNPVTVSPGDQGGPMTNGALHTGEILLGEVDVWTFTANVGERLAVHVGQDTETDDFRPWIRVWSPTGASLGDVAGVDATVIDDIVASTAGTYIVQVASFDSGFDGVGTYRLTMTKTPGPITVSPGDDGGPLTNGGLHTGAIVRGDVDVWTFSATAGDRIAVHIGEVTDTSDLRPWIRLWAPNGASLGDVAGVAATVIDDAIAPTTGTYLVLVASFDSGFDGTGTYQLTMTHTPPPITVTPGDQGGGLSSGNSVTGEITKGDADVWTITAVAGQHISVNISQVTETDDFRPWIRLWAPNGASLGDVAGVDVTAINSAVAPVSGTYMVLVGSFDSGFDGIGTYSLTATVGP